MNIKCLAVGVCLLAGCQAAFGQNEKYRDTNLSVDERVEDLVGRMTLDEKIRQMMNNAPAIDRLGVPAYNWWNECLHGVARSPYNTTSFPQAIAMAATWDRDAIRLMGEYASDEGRAIFNDSRRRGDPGIYKGLTYWSPNINIFRDPRWGRGQETYGEDPYLTGEMGSAFVKGIQGDDPRYLKASACAKHYAVHSGPEWNRHTFNAQVSDQDLWDTYLPAFKKLVTEAGVTGVMCAYNAFLGQVCCGNDILMMDILKNQWGFSGYVTSDCGAIDDFYRTHKLYDSAASASADTVLHGTDCECGSSYFRLAEAVAEGLITEDQIDESLKRLFRIRFRLGMFDPDDRNPYSQIPLSVLESPEHKAHALKMARESMVLLKNDGTLPLDRGKVKKIALVGPNADEWKVFLANYYGFPSEIKTLRQALEAKLGTDVEIVYRKGVNLVDDYVFTSCYDDRLFKVGGGQGFQAEYWTNTGMDGSPVLSRMESRPDYRWGEAQYIAPGVSAARMSAVWKTTFKPSRSGQFCFELRADDWAELLIDGKTPEKVGLVNNYYLLDAVKGKSYEIEIRYRQNAENAEIFFDLGSLVHADYAKTAEEVKDADVILFAGGISSMVEGEQLSVKIDGFYGGDRTSIALPKVQEDMLKALKATGRPVVFVMMTGSAIGLDWEDSNLNAILNAWYGGQAAGEAVSDILFGDYNPSGRLPVTFYRDVEDIPDYQNYSMQDRTYRYFRGTPVYPFGFGLSYTTFEYSDLRIIPEAERRLRVTAVVTNKGNRDGDEVVQLYVSNKRTFVTPLRSLKGFERIFLKSGESREVAFTLTREDLTLVDLYGESIPMTGKIEISIGGCQPILPSGAPSGKPAQPAAADTAPSRSLIPATTGFVSEYINVR